MEDMTTTDFDRIIAVNARGPYLLTRQCLPLLKAAPQATIVNIASVVGVKGYPKQSAYTASKHALRGWSIALAEDSATATSVSMCFAPAAWIPIWSVGSARTSPKRN